MFVSDSNIFCDGSMKVKVCGMDGSCVLLDVGPDFVIDKLKILAVAQLMDPAESAKLSLYHKLVLVGSGQVLTEDSTVAQEDIKDGDEILLVKRRMPSSVLVEPPKKEDAKSGPTLENITQATEGLPSVNTDREARPNAASIDFQSELRRILISLIEAAQRILCLNPEACKIFKEAEDYLEEQTSGPKLDPGLVKQLEDMGFPANRAAKALVTNKMSVSESIQWLLDHGDDPDIDVPLPGMEQLNIPKPADTQEEGSDSGNATAKVTKCKNVAQMLESFRVVRRKQFKPNPRALKNLVDMGFAECDVIDALRISSNKEEDACEWLLGGNKNIPQEELEQGLDPDSALYKAIMSNPVVQLGLSNHRSLQAFLHMLENPSNTQQWLNDSDTGPMLIQISRIYHAEKHVPRHSSSTSTGPTSSSQARPGPSNSS